MTIRAVLFDIGDTLWHARSAPPASEFRRLAAERARQALQARGIAAEDPGIVARALWTSMEAAMRTARATDLVEFDYHEIAREALQKLGIDLPAAEAGALLEATYVSGVEGGKEAYPDAVPTLLALRRRGFKLAYVTNRAFGGERFRADLAATGLDIGWDAGSVSVEVGFLKPHRRLFEHALAQLCLKPSEALMVGNSLAEDVAGAQAAGLLAAWRRSRTDAEGVVPDYAFDEVAELLDLPILKVAGK
jgi:putative hydrolase of the HAD superfamily